MSIPMEAEDLAPVRRIMAQHLHWWGVSEESTDRVLYAVNELLTNVLEHTKPDNGRRLADLLLQQMPGGVTAVIRDQDPRRPLVPVSAKPCDEGGRGIALVQALVDEWDVTVTGAGKDVWIFIAEPSGCL
ncbi:ATP-binding protein [Streptomyces sp. HD1123-B1]|uniref:ATP-binding protein n=1 Tax=Streptomyces huangiella TaxID=3228804 RepID=UPI003D7C77B0